MLAMAAPAAAEKIGAKYRDWLDKEVVFIITKEERQLFLKLPTDADREKYIEQFWGRRDPTPGTPENEFKTEHFKRIDYANVYFGGEWAADGWRTDRGKIWIILGQPQSRQFHTSGGQIYPIELWFYGAHNEPALPPFFYVMFYQPYGMSDYRLYSPYIDGPDKLVRAAGAENVRERGYRFLRDYNRELARASLSLIPSEPADIGEGPSLTSDSMLMKIINLANDKFHKERLGLTARLREEVTFRVSPDSDILQVTALPLRNAAGEDLIHYSLQIPDPPNYTLGRYKDKYYLSMEATVRVLDANKKLIYETTREAVAYYEDKDMENVRVRPLSFEDRIAVVPGNYQLEFGLLNRVTRTYLRTATAVLVPPANGRSLTTGKPVVVQKCQPAASADEPFAISGSRCALQARHEVAPGVTASLNLLFPVHLPEGAATASEQPLKVQYTLGRMDRTVANRVTEDTLLRKRFDRFGSLWVGKSLPLGELPAGNYLLTIGVHDPAIGQSATTTFPFRVGGQLLPPPNILQPADQFIEEGNGTHDYWRGLCALAQQSADSAAIFFEHTLQRNDKNFQARVKLANIQFAKGEYEKVAALLEAGGVENITDAATLQKLMSSLEKTGQVERAIQAAEQSLAKLTPTREVYQDLAALYDRAGQPQGARKALEEARKLSELTKGPQQPKN